MFRAQIIKTHLHFLRPDKLMLTVSKAITWRTTSSLRFSSILTWKWQQARSKNLSDVLPHTDDPQRLVHINQIHEIRTDVGASVPNVDMWPVPQQWNLLFVYVADVPVWRCLFVSLSHGRSHRPTNVRRSFSHIRPRPSKAPPSSSKWSLP